MKHFYFAFYPKDFITATVGMKAEEVGAYIRLLCYQFENGSIPIDDKETLAIIAGTGKIDKVLIKFPCGVNKKMSRVKEQGEYLQSIRGEAGSKGGSKTQAKRKQNSSNDGNININLKIRDKDKDKDIAASPLSFPFDDIWSRYPNKDGRKQAEKAFKASVKTSADFQAITAALTKYLASDRVRNGFIKNGSTWFNNWRDWVPEPPKTPPVKPKHPDDGLPAIAPPKEAILALKNFKIGGIA